MLTPMRKQQAALAALFPFVALSLLNHYYKPQLYRLHPGWFWVADGLQFVVVPLLAWFLILRPAGLRWADCGLARRPHEPAQGLSPGFALFAALLLMAATWPVFTVTHAFLWPYADHTLAHDAIPRSAPGNLLVPLYMSATAAFVEEMAYRALPWFYCRAVLPARGRRLAYVLVTSLVFAVAHSEQGPGGVIATFWYGLVAAWLYLKLRTLWPLVLGHFLVDIVVFGPW